MVSMTANITAIAVPSLLAPNDKSLKNAVESRSCDTLMMSQQIFPHLHYIMLYHTHSNILIFHKSAVW